MDLEQFQRLGFRKHDGWFLSNLLRDQAFEISEIRFEPSDTSFIRSNAVASVSYSQLYRRGRVPARLGLLDLRMGTRDKRFTCATCGNGMQYCHGHSGNLELSLPVYNPHYLRWILAFLRCICASCLRPRVLSAQSKIPNTSSSSTSCSTLPKAKNIKPKLFDLASRLKNQVQCPHEDCRALHPKYRTVANTFIRRIWSPRAKAKLSEIWKNKDPHRLDQLLQPLRAVDVYDIIAWMKSTESAGPNNTGTRMDEMSRHVRMPCDIQSLMICTLPISPVSIRPPVVFSAGSKLRGEAEQTVLLQAITKQNARISRAMLAGARKHISTVQGPTSRKRGIQTSSKNSSGDAMDVDVISEEDTSGALATIPSYMKSSKFTEAYDALQITTSSFISASVKAYTPNFSKRKKSGEIRRSLSTLLCGKEGLLRGNIQGKRVGNAARTVVTGNPHIDLDQVVIPEFIATRLHRVEPVTRFNLAKMRNRVLKGSGVLGGALKVYPPGSDATSDHGSENIRSFHLKNPSTCSRLARILSPGYTVVRYLESNDYVLFNRQPSLSKKSMMAFRALVVPDETRNGVRRHRTVFGMHLGCTTPFNADFDGDEMNVHVLNSYESIAEGKEIVGLTNQITNELNSKATVSVVQDSVLGAYLLSADDVFFNRGDFMQLIAQIGNSSRATSESTSTAGILKRDPSRSRWAVPGPAISKRDANGSLFERWSGKQVMSAMMPPLTMRTGNPLKGGFIMINGRVLQGRFTKKIINGGASSLIHKTALYFGDIRAAELIEDLQRVTRVFLQWRVRGACMAADSLLPRSKESAERVRALVREGVHFGEKICKAGLKDGVPSEKIERDALQFYSAILRMDTFLEPSRPPDTGENALMVMMRSMAKGSPINMAQMRTCVGQQCHSGMRPRSGPADAPDDPRIHSHVHFPEVQPSNQPSSSNQTNANKIKLTPWSESNVLFGTSAEGRGFVHSSFLDGLSPGEFFIHSMAGREGVIDTAVKTAEAGYLNRKLCKTLEDITISYDQTVRDTGTHRIISFAYGDGDRMDPKKLCVIRVGYLLAEPRIGIGFHNCVIRNRFVKYRKQCMKLIPTICFYRGVNGFYPNTVHSAQLQKPDLSLALPFSISCLLSQFSRENHNSKNGTQNTKMASRTYIIKKVLDLLDFLEAGGDPALTGYPACGPPQGSTSTNLFLRTEIAFHMQPSKVMPITRSRMDWIIDRCKKVYSEALATPGDSVGAMAGTSLGCSLTQSTLNTFHFAGVAEKINVTLGLPRYNEIVNARLNIKNAYVDIPILESNEESCKREVARAFPSLTVEDDLPGMGIWSTYKSSGDLNGRECRGVFTSASGTSLRGSCRKCIILDSTASNERSEVVIETPICKEEVQWVHKIMQAERIPEVCVSTTTITTTDADKYRSENKRYTSHASSHGRARTVPHRVTKRRRTTKKTNTRKLKREKRHESWDSGAWTTGFGYIAIGQLREGSDIDVHTLSRWILESAEWGESTKLPKLCISFAYPRIISIRPLYPKSKKQPNQITQYKIAEHMLRVAEKIIADRARRSQLWSAGYSTWKYEKSVWDKLDTSYVHKSRMGIVKGWMVRNMSGGGFYKRGKSVDTEDTDEWVGRQSLRVFCKSSSSLSDVWYILRREGVSFDYTHSYTNHIHVIAKCLGIESARALIAHEFHEVLTGDGTYISPRHVGLVADFMTSRGVFAGLTRHALKKIYSDRGPLSRACFEQPIETLVDAAVQNTKDSVQTNAARILVGGRSMNGTGSFKVLTTDTYARIMSKYASSATTKTFNPRHSNSARMRSHDSNANHKGKKICSSDAKRSPGRYTTTSSFIDSWIFAATNGQKRKALHRYGSHRNDGKQPKSIRVMDTSYETDDLHPLEKMHFEEEDDNDGRRNADCRGYATPSIESKETSYHVQSLYQYETLMQQAHESFSSCSGRTFPHETDEYVDSNPIPQNPRTFVSDKNDSGSRRNEGSFDLTKPNAWTFSKDPWIV